MTRNLKQVGGHLSQIAVHLNREARALGKVSISASQFSQVKAIEGKLSSSDSVAVPGACVRIAVHLMRVPTKEETSFYVNRATAEGRRLFRLGFRLTQRPADFSGSPRPP